ncbi:CCHamide precursor [Danaus plexippus plexippus]|uniref:CCHamide n=1 Tax=Danaus plexippus plexippus TaxID=278856 RepID=A0A212ERE8_DANPL|nr:CCHamide precursor [Danaus plexippus plexippus]
MAANTFTLSVLAVLIISVGVSAKRGCSSFGHSCFGGHGKRSDSGMDNELTRQQAGQEEIPPHPGYPHSYVLPDDVIPIRDGGKLNSQSVFERDENNARDVVKMKLHNLLKYWMDNYRRSRLNDEDGYVIGSL